MGAKKSVSPAERAALTAILREGSFSVGVMRGFTGYARPRLRIYGPSQLSTRTFLRLRNAGLVRQIMQDDLKEIWDISRDGIESLRSVDIELAALNPEFYRRRLETPTEVWFFDEIGLARRRTEAKHNNRGESLQRIGHDQKVEETNTIPSTLAQAQFAISQKKLASAESGLELLVNECLAVADTFLKAKEGAARIDLEIAFSGREPTKATCTYTGLSFDAGVSETENIHLKSLISSLCQNQAADLAAGDKICVHVSTQRRKVDGAIEAARIPETVSFCSVLKRVRSALLELGPDGLCKRPVLTIRYGRRPPIRGRGGPATIVPVEIEWSRSNGSASRHALEGRGAVKANAAVWRAAGQLSGVTRPPCRALTFQIEFA